MITLGELSTLFCKDLTLARVARALLGSNDLLTANELASSGAFSLKLVSRSFEALSDLGLAQISPGLAGDFTCKIRIEAR